MIDLYKIAITLLPKVGPKTARQLISYSGGVEAVFKASKKELIAIPAIGEVITNSILKNKAKALLAAEKELGFVEKNDVQLLFYTDKNYPKRLKHYDDSPALMYYKGNSNLNAARMVAVVGTRKQTERGQIVCEELIEGLRRYNVTIISGLAYGVDITAHRKSLKVGMETIGVMGTGLGSIYPLAHKATAQKMIGQGGLLTEFVHTAKPDRERFPMRNRIIAGLCDAIVVVESAQRGGSIITAKMANQYNKDVFAVPGRLNDEFSKGCNHLIKSHQAALLESAEDIGYIMRWDAEDAPKLGIQKQLFVELSDDERKVVDLLRTKDSIGVDELSYQLKWNTSKIAGVILNLEFKGMVKTLPGKRYMLI